MCGICGIYSPKATPKVSEELLRRMNSSLERRGPDDEGYFVSDLIGLAMRRLSIIDLTGGAQPLFNEDKSIWIVFNGEIYNFMELRRELVSLGHQFRTASDTEVIVHLYEEMGERCVDRLNGMFAFGLWDSRNSKLVLARDRLGIKPLFYSAGSDNVIYFGSEIKALLRAPIDRAPDYQALYDYLSLMYVPTPSTAFRDIRKLPPASLLICSPDGIKIKSYWDIPVPEASASEDRNRDYEHEVIDLIEESVSRQMISDVPIGAFLSGGLDSTTIAAIMVKNLKAKLKTFTIGFDRKSYDESADARLVAQTLGCDHTEQMVSPDMVESIPELLDYFDEPFADYSAIPTFLVSRLAVSKVKVTLTGDGGDEVFAGYPTHVAYKLSAIFRSFPAWLKNGLIKPLVFALPASMERISFDYKAKRFVTGADLDFERGHYWWKVIFNEEEKKLLLSHDFMKSGFSDSYEVLGRHFAKVRNGHPLNQLLYVDAKTFLLDDNLVKVDRMTMINSLEARVPLLDHELVEKVAMMPPRVKTRLLETKILLRKAVRNLLPAKIRKGKKKGFTPPLPHWIRGELKPLAMEYFSGHKLRDTGILNPAYCKKILDEHLSGMRDNNRQIWTILALVRWFEKHKA